MPTWTAPPAASTPAADRFLPGSEVPKRPVFGLSPEMELKAALTSEKARKVLERVGHADFGTLDAYLDNANVPAAERLAVARVGLKHAPPDKLAAQALIVCRLDDPDTARRALTELGEHHPGVKRALSELEPDLPGSGGRKLLYERLLSNPKVGADDAAQMQLAQTLLSNANGLPAADRIPLARACLARLSERGAVASMATYLLQLGDVATARATLGSLAEQPECAGLKQALELFEPACTTPRSREQLYNRLLAQPTMRSEDGSLVTQLMTYLESEPGVRKKVAAVWLDRLLEGSPPVEVLAAHGKVCLEGGDEPAARRALERLKTRPECLGLALADRELGPICPSQDILLERLLATPRLGADLKSQEKMFTTVLSSMQTMIVPEDQRRAFAGARVDQLMQLPLDDTVVGALAYRARSAVSLFDFERGEKAALHLMTASPKARAVHADLSGLLCDRVANQRLMQRILEDPFVPDRAAFISELGTALTRSGVDVPVRQELLRRELDRALAGLPGTAAEVGTLAELAARQGDKTAIERAVKGLHTVGPVKNLHQDWAALTEHPDIREALVEVLLREPPGSEESAARQRVRDRWVSACESRGLPVDELNTSLDLFESARAARLAVARMSGAERTTGVAEQGGRVVIGGIAVPRRQS